MSDLVVIAHGRCQSGRSGGNWDKAVRRLREIFGNSLDIRYTSRRGDGARLARTALLEGARWLAAAGGDGTIHEVVNGCFEGKRNIQPKSSLSFLPLGRGNDWIRTLDLPADTQEAIVTLVRGKARHVDVGHTRLLGLSGKEEERIFINVAEAGVGAKVVEKTDRDGMSLGTTRSYALAAVRATLSYLPRRLQLVLDGADAVTTEPLLSLIAANGRYFGAGMKCAPMAHPDDGMLEVIAIGHFTRLEVAWYFPSFMRGTYLAQSRVRHYSVRKIEIASAEQVLLELDGELAGALPATIDILPQALQIRC
jgi:YegS/Rv2252/BmrU family lipid kinase